MGGVSESSLLSLKETGDHVWVWLPRIPQQCEKAFEALLPFPPPRLCEASFSSYVSTETVSSNRRNIGADVTPQVSSIKAQSFKRFANTQNNAILPLPFAPHFFLVCLFGKIYLFFH